MDNLLERLAQIVGAKYLVTANNSKAESLHQYTKELRGRFHSECLAVVLPADTEQVVAVLKCCAEAAVSVVPQGGNTGAMGGAVARADQIILNLARMNRIEEVDEANYSMRVQAGCILADVQEAAANHHRFFPLSLGAQGSCQIGGNLATNAGGINVLRYGNTRDLVLGLEVVLADGRVCNDLNSLRKNNTGYDLKNLFIGSEGTLGIITAATLKLFPAPRCQVVALVGLKDAESALELLGRVRAASSDRLTTYELMANIAVQSAVAHIDGQTDPLPTQHDWYVLIVATSSNEDAESSDTESDLRSQMETCLMGAIQQGVVQEVVLAENESQVKRLVLLRENIVGAQKFVGNSIKHDVSVPVAMIPEFFRRTQSAIEKAMPGARPYPYGHMGDGNIHFNIAPPVGMDAEEFLAEWQAINEVVHEVAHQLGGSFSAEHGIGIAKLSEMKRYKDPVVLELYLQIKQVLDPKNLLNPGKLNP